MRASDWPRAVALFRQAVEADRDGLSAWRMLGAAANRMGDEEEAARALTEVVRLAPGDRRAATALGGLLARLERWAEAEAAFRAAACAETFTSVLPRLADAVERQGRPWEAAVILDMHLTHAPEDARAAVRLGQLRQKIGDRAAATRAFERALRLDPSHDGAAMALAQLRAEGGDEPGAVALLQALVQARPQNPVARLRLAAMLRAAGRLGEAETALGVEAASDPRLASMLGQIREEGGDIAGAEAGFRAAVDAAPDRPAYLRLLALNLVRQGRRAEVAPLRARLAEMALAGLPETLAAAIAQMSRAVHADATTDPSQGVWPDRRRWSAEERRAWGRAANELLVNWATYKEGGADDVARLAPPIDVDELGRDGRGLVLVGCHLGTYAPILARLLATQADMRIVSTSPHYMLTYPSPPIVAAGGDGRALTTELAVALRRGGLVYLAADGKVGRQSERAYRIGGRAIRLPVGAAALAFTSRAPAYWSHAAWTPAGLTTELVAAPPRQEGQAFETWLELWHEFVAERMNAIIAQGPENLTSDLEGEAV
ncbi:MAG: tetratricopeptide repeat protein [Rhizobiales bacterium]|nr:tetratricopeptide repeat protein [Hyphomicrobiales bacterium]